MATLTHDPEAAQAMQSDPLMYLRPITWLTAAGGAAFSHANWALYPQLHTPLLAVHGTADKNANPAGSRQLIQVVASEDKTLHLVAGALHAPLDDSARDETLAVILRWLEERLPMRPLRSSNHKLRLSP
jgi:alpha-beta hydrolase superfamily lysophospholipase